MWQRWRPVFGWETLCPILAADPLGIVVVMRRAEQPVTFADIESLPDDYPDITAESKVEDYGRVGAVVVAVDYGLPDSDMVLGRRAYYKKMSETK